MPFYIRTKDGDLLLVESRVGDGLTKFDITTVETRDEPAMEPSEEDTQ